MNYYNENDPRAAAWLRELVKAHLIPAGEVDERSIVDVQPADIAGFVQCHFFAGIGGWSYALQLAGWPEDEPVWTGSCPCQPFSAAGRQKGHADERHLWPEFARLIAACKPATVFGEQVASKLGREWLSGVFADLEALDYQRAGADLCAAGAGSPHIRQRLYWLAHAGQQSSRNTAEHGIGTCASNGEGREKAVREFTGHCGLGGVSDSEGQRRNGGAGVHRQNGRAIIETGCGMGNPNGAGLQGRQQCEGGSRELPAGPPGAWSSFDILPFKDGKFRRVESGTFPLAHGIPGRMAKLRGLGNAIVPQVAAGFIKACREAIALQAAANIG